MEHIVSVIKAPPPKPYLLSCSCGDLYMEVCKEDVGVLIKIHWEAVEKRR